MAEREARDSPDAVRGLLDSGKDLLDRRPLTCVFGVAVVARLVMALVACLVSDKYLIPDEGTYLNFAEAVSRGIEPNDLWPGYGQSFVDSTRVFLLQVAAIFDVFGRQRFLAQMPAVLYGSLAAVVVTRTAMLGLRRWFAIGAGLVAALFPSQVFWSSLVLRESMIWLGLACLVFLAAWAKPGRSRQDLLLVAVGAGVVMIALLWLRVQTAVIAMWCFGIVFALRRGERLLRMSVAMLLLLAIPWSVGLGPLGLHFFDGALSRLGYTRTVLALRADSAFDYEQQVAESAASQEVDLLLGDAFQAAEEVASGDAARRVEAAAVRAESAATGAGAAELAALKALEAARRAAELARAEAAASAAAELAVEAAEAALEAARAASVAAREAIEAGEEAATALREVHRLADEAAIAAGRAAEEATAGAWAVLSARDEDVEPIETSLRMFHLGVYNTMLRPLPWQATRSIDLFAASLETPLWLAMYALVAVGAWRFRRDAGLVAMPILLTAGIVAAGAVSHGNLGTAFRHRGQLVVVFAILAMAGVQSLVDSRRERGGMTPTDGDGSA